MKVIHGVHPDDFKKYDTATIRERFLLSNLSEDDKVNFVYTHYDRMIVGIAKPVNQKIELGNYSNLRSDYFLERREMGIINVGGDGIITANNENFSLTKLDCIYIGKGIQQVSFTSVDAINPAVFYILSAPAHASYPTKLF